MAPVLIQRPKPVIKAIHRVLTATRWVLLFGALWWGPLNNTAVAQAPPTKRLSLQQAQRLAAQQGPRHLAAAHAAQAAQLAAQTAAPLPPLEVEYQGGQFNNVLYDHQLMAVQPLPWPGKRQASRAMAQAEADRAQVDARFAKADLALRVHQAYANTLLMQARLALLRRQDSLLGLAQAAAQQRQQAKKTNGLEIRAMALEQLRLRADSLQATAALAKAKALLAAYCGLPQTRPWAPTDSLAQVLPPPEYVAPAGNGPLAKSAFRAERDRLTAATHQARASRAPDFRLGYYVLSIEHEAPFQGPLFGLSLPLAPKAIPALANTQARLAELDARQAAWAKEQAAERRALQIRLNGYWAHLINLKDQGLPQALDLEATGWEAYRAGEITFAEARQYTQQALQLQLAYLDAAQTYLEDWLALARLPLKLPSR